MQVKCQGAVLDHIKNSPNSAFGREAPIQPASATTRLDLLHPNELGELTPWQLDFRQLDAGPMCTKVAVRMGQKSSILNIAMNKGVHQRGVCPDGWSTFGISQGGSISSWQGQSVERDAFLTFGDNDGFDGVTTNAFVGNVLSFETGAFEAFAETCGYAIYGGGPATRFLPSDQSAARMARLKRNVLRLLVDPGQHYTEGTEDSLMLDVLSLLSVGKVHEDKSRAQIRRRAVSRALELMQANLDDPVSIQDLCKAAGASWRTLDRAFNERFEQGPKAYYIRLRLNEVRRELLAGSPEDVIAEVANRYGFWHMGQFAHDYRQFFGELPSETMRLGPVAPMIASRKAAKG